VPGPWRIADAAHDPRYKHLSANVGERSFLSAAIATGINRKDVYRILTAVGALKNLDRCRPKDAFSALLDTETGRLTAFEYAVSDEEVYQGKENDEAKLVAKKLDLDVQRHRANGVIILNGSFEEAARRAGFEPGLGDVVNRALSGYLSTTEFKAGDVLGVVAQEVTVLGSFARYAGVEALEYRPVSGDPLRIYYNDTDKSRGYVDSRGRAFGRSRFSRPVPGAGVTSRFNPRRMHPILKRIKPHNGTDFGAPIGTPVLATSAGRIAFVGRAGPNGNMISIAHGGGITTGYSHLSRFVKGVRVGMNVDQRQLIGYVGSTGRSTGPHLHFSAKRNGRFIDPETLNLDGLARLSQDQRLPAEVRRRYDRMLDELHLPAPRAPQAADIARSEPSSPLQVEIASARVAPAAVVNPPPPEPATASQSRPREAAGDVLESPPPISFEPEPATVLPLPPQSILATPVEGQDLEPLD
jgi:murein DD-endopeptidase MepM/ murein hydrolase activator NlpD